MLVNINWLKELVALNLSADELAHLIALRVQGGTKEVTKRFIELDLKGYNRADLLSLRGVALEVAAITDSKVNFQEEEDFSWKKQNLPGLKVEVKDFKLVPVYCLAKIEGLKIENSPQEWQEKLKDSGMRSVNSATDVTNLVMLEYGQPMHAFDAATVENEEIIVRAAFPNESLVTLDNKTRKLLPDDLLITDPQKPLGLAGVMGGKNSEVTTSTTAILLEAAIFDPVTIRKTAQRLRLTSEASKRFQHGLTTTRLFQALNAAIKIYEELGGKLTAISIVGDKVDTIKKVQLSQTKTSSLIGVKIKPAEIENYLGKLHFSLNKIKEGEWEVEVPYWRLDIEIEEDLIEEVARLYGYEKIPAQELGGKLPTKTGQQPFILRSDLKKNLATIGLTEVQTYSFYSSEVIENLRLDKDNLIEIANPISSATQYLRTKIWPNLLKAAAENLKSRTKLAIFEVGKTYHPQEGEPPEEKYKLAALLINDSDAPIQELATILQKLSTKLQLDYKIEPVELNEDQTFHPVRFTTLKSKGQTIGKLAEVHPRVTYKFGITKRVAIAEIELV